MGGDVSAGRPRCRPGVLLRAVFLAAAVLCTAFLPPSAARSDPDPGATASQVQFEATSDGATVRLHWFLPPSPAVVGFQLLRARRVGGPYAPINPWLILAGPTGDYAFSDLAVDPGATYHYQVEAVGAAGHKYLLGPLSIVVMPEESRRLQEGGGFPARAAPPKTDVGGGCVTAGFGC
jgi:hypothetical protein